MQDFPGGLLVKNPLCNAGDMGLIPGRGTKIPHATAETRRGQILKKKKMHPSVDSDTAYNIRTWKQLNVHQQSG